MIDLKEAGSEGSKGRIKEMVNKLRARRTGKLEDKRDENLHTYFNDHEMSEKKSTKINNKAYRQNERAKKLKEKQHKAMGDDYYTNS